MNNEIIVTTSKTLNDAIKEVVDPQGYKFPDAVIAQVQAPLVRSEALDIIPSLHIRECGTNLFDNEGDSLLGGRVMLDNKSYLFLLSNAAPFESLSQVSELYFTQSKSGGKGQAFTGNGGGATILAGYKHDETSVYIVGTKINGDWRYLMAKRQGANDFPRSEITSVIDDKVKDVFGDEILNKYSNMFIVPIEDKSDETKSSVMFSPSHINLVGRLMGDDMLTEFRRRGGDFRFCRNVTLNAKDENGINIINRSVMSVPLNSERDDAFVSETIKLQCSATDVRCYDENEPCKVDIDIEVKIKICPGLKNSSGHILNLRDNYDIPMHFGRGEKYNLIVSTPSVGMNEKKGSVISSRYKSEPVYVKSNASGMIARPLGLCDQSYEKHLDKSQAMKVLEYMEKNGIDINYAKIKNSVAGASPYIIYDVNLYITKVKYEGDKIIDLPDYGTQARLFGRYNCAFYVATYPNIVSLLQQGLKELRSKVDPSLTEKIMTYFQVISSKGISINLEESKETKDSNIQIIDFDKTKKTGKIMEYEPISPEVLSASAPFTKYLKFRDKRNGLYYKHAGFIHVKKPIIVGEERFGEGYSLEPVYQDDLAELWILSIGAPKKIKQIEEK